MAFEAAPVLIALHHGFGGGPVPMTALASLAKDGADPKTGRMPNPAARTAIRAIRAALPAPSKTDSFVKEMTQALVQEGLIHKRTEKGPYSAYDVYSIPRNGREAAIATRCTRAALAAAAASPVTVAHGKAARDAIRARVGALPPIVLPVPEAGQLAVLAGLEPRLAFAATLGRRRHASVAFTSASLLVVAVVASRPQGVPRLGALLSHRVHAVQRGVEVVAPAASHLLPHRSNKSIGGGDGD